MKTCNLSIALYSHHTMGLGHTRRNLLYFDRCGSAAEARLPEGMSGVIVTGPFMPEKAKERLRQRVSKSPRPKLLDFVPEATALIAAAERIVTMGGYNTVSEVLCHEKPALIVPWVRREQLVRAERLFRLGLADLLHPDALSPDTLSDWLRQPMSSPGARRHLDFGGLARLPRLLVEVLDQVPVMPSPESGLSEAQTGLVYLLSSLVIPRSSAGCPTTSAKRSSCSCVESPTPSRRCSTWPFLAWPGSWSARLWTRSAKRPFARPGAR